MAPPTGRAHGGDDARSLRAAGAALHRGSASIPALAPVRLRPSREPGGRALPVRARNVRPRDSACPRLAGRRVRLASTGWLGRGIERRTRPWGYSVMEALPQADRF